MDPAQGESQGKSVTSKLKAKVKGVKGKVHLPGHKKRHGDGGQADEAGDGSDYSSDDAPKKPGPETGYNVGASTPYTTVQATPVAQARGGEEMPSTTMNDAPPSQARGGDRLAAPRDAHNYASHTIRTAPMTDDTLQYQAGAHTTRTTNSGMEKMAKMDEDEEQPTPTKPSEGVLGTIKNTVGGAAAAVGSTVGFYTEVDQTPVTPPPPDPNAPTMMDKAKATLGMDNPGDPNAPTMMEKTKASLGLDKPRDPNAPTMMEKTKASLGLDKPRDPNAPTMMEKTKATLGMGTVSPSSETSSPQPSVVDRVSGAISSLLMSSPKESKAGEDVQQTFPAQSDYVRPAATGPRQVYGGRRAEERIGTAPAEGYYQPTNRY